MSRKELKIKTTKDGKLLMLVCEKIDPLEAIEFAYRLGCADSNRKVVNKYLHNRASRKLHDPDHGHY